MAEDIQNMYSRDYGRKKKNAFRISVEKAYEYVKASIKRKSTPKQDGCSKYEKRYLEKKQKLIVSESVDTSSDSDNLSDDDSFSSDNPDYVIQPDTNSMNNCLTIMYQKTPMKGNPDNNHGSQSSATGPPRKQTDDSSAMARQLFMIDRKGNRSGEPSVIKLDLRNGSQGACPSPTAKEKSLARNSVTKPSYSISGRQINESRNASQSGTLGHHKTVSETQDDDPELVILDATPTASDGEVCPSADLDHLRSSASGKGDRIKLQPSEQMEGTIKHKATQPSVTTEPDNLTATAGFSEKRQKVLKNKEVRLTKKKAKMQTSEIGTKPQKTDIQRSTVKFSDIGGNDNTLKDICKLLVHMKHPEVYERLGITPPRGFLLHGPPGCGKTLMAHAIAGELELPFIKVAATELISGVSGESEEKIRDIFDRAVDAAPCVLFIDEVDAITPKRETASKDMERRVVSQLLTCMDELNQKPQGHVLVLGATNRPDSLDPALRRAGRFDREISLGIPGQDARLKILQVLCKGLRLGEEFNFTQLARLTPGFVGADLMALTREAAITAVNRIFQSLQSEPSTCLTSHQENEHSNRGAVHHRASPTNQSNECVYELYDADEVIDLEQQDELSSMCEGSVADNGDGVIEVTSATESSLDDRRLQTGSRTGTSCPDGATCNKGDSSPNTDESSEFKSVLSWLKDYPPLTDQQLDDLFITMEDFKEALSHVQPSAKREGFATIPDVTWEDIGALKAIREELQMAIMAPVQHPEQFKALGMTSPPGVLLAGPPGCGKTLLAKAIANESGINFISVKGPELLNMYVGESERAVRQVFQRAKNSAPCVIFFDELDALCPRRSGSAESGASVRVVNQLLTEMDGLEARKQVFIMAATNRPDIIDPAILRPGRLDKVLYVGIPTVQDRLEILITITKNGSKPRLAPDVSLRSIADDARCEGYTGADLAALVREAAVTALRSHMGHLFSSAPAQAVTSSAAETQPIVVTSSHFDVAFHKVKPSVSAKDQTIYAKMKARAAPDVLE